MLTTFDVCRNQNETSSNFQVLTGWDDGRIQIVSLESTDLIEGSPVGVSASDVEKLVVTLPDKVSRLRWALPDSAVKFAAAQKDSVHVFERDHAQEEFKEVKVLQNHALEVNSLVWSSDASLLATAGRDLKCVIVDASSYQTLHILDVAGSVSGCAFNPTSSKQFACCMDRHLKLYDLTSPSKPQYTSDLKHSVNSLSWSPDGYTICVGTLRGSFCLLDLKERIPKLVTSRDEFSSSEPIQQVSYSPHLYKVDGVTHPVTLVCVASNEKLIIVTSHDQRTVSSHSLQLKIPVGDLTWEKDRVLFQGEAGCLYQLAIPSTVKRMSGPELDSFLSQRIKANEETRNFELDRLEELRNAAPPAPPDLHNR